MTDDCRVYVHPACVQTMCGQTVDKGPTKFYRYRCTRCGRCGDWVMRPATVLRQLHKHAQKSHHTPYRRRYG
jgi:hypothetical protein